MSGASDKTFSDLRMSGGQISHAGGGNSTIHILGNMSFTSLTTSTITLSGTNGRNWAIDSLVSGDGTMLVDGGDRFLSFTEAANTYSGFLDARAGILNFDYDHNTTATLSLTSTAELRLDQDLTFSQLILGMDSIDAGTYTEGDLVAINAGYATYFNSGGNGTSTITVIPEPASALLGLTGLVLACLRRRR